MNLDGNLNNFILTYGHNSSWANAGYTELCMFLTYFTALWFSYSGCGSVCLGAKFLFFIEWITEKPEDYLWKKDKIGDECLWL